MALVVSSICSTKVTFPKLPKLTNGSLLQLRRRSSPLSESSSVSNSSLSGTQGMNYMLHQLIRQSLLASLGSAPDCEARQVACSYQRVHCYIHSPFLLGQIPHSSTVRSCRAVILMCCPGPNLCNLLHRGVICGSEVSINSPDGHLDRNTYLGLSHRVSLPPQLDLEVILK